MASEDMEQSKFKIAVLCERAGNIYRHEDNDTEHVQACFDNAGLMLLEADNEQG